MRKAKTATESLFQPPAELKPLAERMRPQSLDEMVGQRRLLAPGSALRRAIESGHVHSMVLWGPPGCGKTTLALLLAKYAEAEFQAISAVLSGLPEVREVLAQAQNRFNEGRRTVLFVDEVHRFNKAQQDAFLPHIERGSILFIGATTENPSFELNSALLSRCRVHVLDAVGAEDIVDALKRALSDQSRGLGGQGVRIDDDKLRPAGVIERLHHLRERSAGGRANFEMGAAELRAAQHAEEMGQFIRPEFRGQRGSGGAFAHASKRREV